MSTPKPYLHEARLLLRREIFERKRGLTKLSRESGLGLAELQNLLFNEIGSPELVASLLGFLEKRRLEENQKNARRIAEIVKAEPTTPRWRAAIIRKYEVALWTVLTNEFLVDGIEHPDLWDKGGELTSDLRWAKRQALEIIAKQKLLQRIPWDNKRLRQKVYLEEGLNYFKWKKRIEDAATKSGSKLLDGSQIPRQSSLPAVY